MTHRYSVVSMESFESLPEEGAGTSQPIPILSKQPPRRSPPSAFDSPTRSRARRRLYNDRSDEKRRRIINEFYETERSYFGGLELIYSHFLTPIIESLETPNPLLDRTQLTSIFVNFIDIWNLHRSFFSSLSAHLQTPAEDGRSPTLSSILLSHFPYLSLYSPFVASFDTSMSSYMELIATKPDFAVFITKQEADPRCGNLKLRDWLLSIIQRCPRYLLLLRDLISCTSIDDPEHAPLVTVHTLVSKITLSLNTSLHTHAQTLSLLAIQRSTPNLPFQLISPGRSLLKRGPLLHVEASSPKEREFLLFSDCFLWLSNADKVSSGELIAEKLGRSSSPPVRPPMIRNRSKSDAELPKSTGNRSSSVLPSSKSQLPSRSKARYPSSSTEEKWIYKGHVELVDIDVVVPPALETNQDHRLEILSPHLSFALYASSGEERDAWVEAIRSARASLMTTLTAMNPNSTLTSSTSTNHLRQTLQALPHLPEDDDKNPPRGKVEHFVPAIWIPDGKTDTCMRCGRPFGWRRRRHHCRLCGRCVCGSCSGKTFYIAESTKNRDRHKAARACEQCYETVFPIMDGTPSIPGPSVRAAGGTMNSLSELPEWRSVRISNLGEDALASASSALLAVDLGPQRESSQTDREPSFDDPVLGRNASPRVRIKPASRPRSYLQILEDFNEGSPSGSGFTTGQRSNFEASSTGMNNSIGVLTAAGASGYLSTSISTSGEFSPESAEPTEDVLESPSSPEFSPPPKVRWSISASPRRKEDTIRKKKRFSMPALAIQTTTVTAKTNVNGTGKTKRFSLILGGRGSSSQPNLAENSKLRTNIEEEEEASGGDSGFRNGAAVGKLSELLARSSSKNR
ncbi:hypothetical protein BDM02DRAFT_3184175 [Thelephora ganbajun]|uniref:Uncharacterized protein n=1 Tax=Thelephora ganbajun TaxID=370292 RepID=A0ACB6ZQW6_THEGA|nr:hypothetical protein BDM02DRAFT_3184175 [Thelephora ganbajun]